MGNRTSLSPGVFDGFPGFSPAIDWDATICHVIML